MMRYNERIIYVMQDFSDTLASNVIKLLFELDSKPGDILLLVNSTGGDISAMTAIHDAMKLVRNDVATLCIGNAYSSAATIVVAGAPGKRFITRHSELMFHEPSIKIDGKLSNLNDDILNLQRSHEIIKNILAANLKVDVNSVLVTRTDSYFNAEEAVKIGAVDHIVENIDDVLKRLNFKPKHVDKNSHSR